MTQRSVNRKGWGTRDTDTDVLVAVTNADTTPNYLNPKITAGAGITTAVLNPGANESLQITNALTPGQLQALIPYMQVCIPACAMSGGVGTRAPIFQTIQINAQQQTMDVLEFPEGVDREAYITLTNRDFPFMDYSDPKFKVYPTWFQTNSSSAPSPTEYVYWEAGIGVTLNGATFDFTMEPTPAGQAIQSKVLDAWKHSGAGTTGALAIECDTTDIFGGTLAGSVWNAITFEVERFGASVLDTFDDSGDSAYLVSIAIQYATNFNNKAVWPVT